MFARLSELEKALKPGEAAFQLHSEPTNSHDTNAIKVVVAREGFFETKHHHVGYVPKDIAAEIAAAGNLSSLRFRPKTLWIGDINMVNLYEDILGPR